MSTSTVTGKHTDAFTSQEQGMILPSALLGETLSFFEPEGLRTVEAVCQNWRKCTTHQWKKQCQNMLGLSPNIDPIDYLPEGFSYKKSFELISPHIFGRSAWRRYIGDVGPVSPIPKAISPKKWNEPDPCDPTTTIGKAYVWMYCPSHVEIASGRKVPVTINNIAELFKGKYSYIWEDIVEQHGDKEIQPGWRCMRKNVIGKSLTFDQQKELAKEKGVVITQLLERIVFNFVEHARSNVYLYPDGQDPCSYARTLTLVRDDQGRDWPSGCGAGGPAGLRVHSFRFIAAGAYVGVGVALPAEVQAIGP